MNETRGSQVHTFAYSICSRWSQVRPVNVLKIICFFITFVLANSNVTFFRTLLRNFVGNERLSDDRTSWMQLKRWVQSEIIFSTKRVSAMLNTIDIENSSERELWCKKWELVSTCTSLKCLFVKPFCADKTALFTKHPCTQNAIRFDANPPNVWHFFASFNSLIFVLIFFFGFILVFVTFQFVFCFSLSLSLFYFVCFGRI